MIWNSDLSWRYKFRTQYTSCPQTVELALGLCHAPAIYTFYPVHRLCGPVPEEAQWAQVLSVPWCLGPQLEVMKWLGLEQQGCRTHFQTGFPLPSHAWAEGPTQLGMSTRTPTCRLSSMVVSGYFQWTMQGSRSKHFRWMRSCPLLT